jgi:outer membrane protein assembly factor BamC
MKLFKWSLPLLVMLLGGCGITETGKIDYKSSGQKTTPLVVPPDLTQLSKDTRYAIVNGSVSASTAQTTAELPKSAIELGTVGVNGIRMERQGNQRWLVVNQPAESTWSALRKFWQDNGFVLATDDKPLGIMETEWAENRAKIPQDGLRKLLGSVIDRFYSTAERDKFRTRIEINAQGETEVYVSHRGVIEVYTEERSGQTIWQPRPTDPELETEFLRRIMLSLGSTEPQAKAAVEAATPAALSTLVTQDGMQVLAIAEKFDRAWRRVGLALDRSGFTVEDRDRSKGLYQVRYVPVPDPKNEPGFFKKLFTSKKESQPQKFQVVVQSSQDGAVVSVRDASGAPDQTDSATGILKVLLQETR